MLQQVDSTGTAPTDSVVAAVPMTGDAISRFLALKTFEQWPAVLLRVVLIMVCARVLIYVVDRILTRWTKRYVDAAPLDPRRQRALTIEGLIRSTARYVIWPVALITVLSALKIDITALVATAGVASLAVGFGAQTLVKDVIAGIFLLFDGTVAVGDRISVNGTFGIVEHIGVRLIKVRKFDGELLMVPAGELRIFGNTSIGFTRSIVDIGVAYGTDIQKVMGILEQLGQKWIDNNKEFCIDEKPEVLSIMGFGDSAIMLKLVITVRPGEQFRADRELKLWIKEAFEREGVEIPFPQRTVWIAESRDLRTRS